MLRTACRVLHQPTAALSPHCSRHAARLADQPAVSRQHFALAALPNTQEVGAHLPEANSQGALLLAASDFESFWDETAAQQASQQHQQVLVRCPFD